jgi:GTP pyrophosphokinase
MIDPEYLLNELFNIIKNNQLPVDTNKIKKAYLVAFEAHKNQLRNSGDPYIIHPLSTAIKLAELKLDEQTIIAGLLHDVLEDTTTTEEDIKKLFGQEVSWLVKSVSNLHKIKYQGNQYYIENLRKLFISMAKDIRVVLIRFADRLHNLKTLEYKPLHKRLRTAKESLEIYAPIADRLRLNQIKNDIEDCAFKFVYPKEFEWINKISIDIYTKKINIMRKMKKDIIKHLNEEKVNYISIDNRIKRLYSLYKKLLKHNNDLSRIYDIIALRIIVPDISECYKTLGLIHKKYRPKIGRIKDFISQPKPNGYQSLHTTVFGLNSELFEIQIRTEKMHEEAEFGIAAHWNYKTQDEKKENTDWIKELAQLTKQMKNDPHYLENLKLDIFQNRIFVLTPKGDIIDLPANATPIDFAYHIHSEVGNKCVNAKVNNKIAPLSYKLNNGDLIEIITNKNRKKPNIEWLNFVKTQSAKYKIKAAINKKDLFNDRQIQF